MSIIVVINVRYLYFGFTPKRTTTQLDQMHLITTPFDQTYQLKRIRANTLNNYTHHTHTKALFAGWQSGVQSGSHHFISISTCWWALPCLTSSTFNHFIHFERPTNPEQSYIYIFLLCVLVSWFGAFHLPSRLQPRIVIHSSSTAQRPVGYDLFDGHIAPERGILADHHHLYSHTVFECVWPLREIGRTCVLWVYLHIICLISITTPTQTNHHTLPEHPSASQRSWRRCKCCRSRIASQSQSLSFIRINIT